jgi:hypothetical protein
MIMSGTKTLVNRSSSPLKVTLLGRNGADPSAPSDRKVTVDIPAGQTQPNVRYGDDQNPYLNGLIIALNNGSSSDEQTLRVLRRGDAGTLDNKLNANGILDINYDTSTNAISLTAHN